MNPHEWSLVIFTLLAQLSVGMLITLLVARAYVSKKSGPEQAAKLTDKPFYAVFVLMALALVASLFHLGNVLHIIGAVPNLSTSWMSREVVAAVAFAGLLALLAFMIWRNLGTESARITVGWIAALVGLFLLVTMSWTYMLPAQPAWNTAATPIAFFTTSLLLGVLGTAAVFVLFSQGNEASLEKDVLKGIAIASVVLVGLELLVLPVYLAYLSTQGPTALRTLNDMVGMYGGALVIRLILVFVGGGLLATYLFKNVVISGEAKTLSTLIYSAFVLVLISEVLGRFLFYATSYRIGV